MARLRTGQTAMSFGGASYMPNWGAGSWGGSPQTAGSSTTVSSNPSSAKGLNWGSILGAGGNIAAGLIGKSGQAGANKLNLQIAREQMEFQERMSGTAYQRAAKDLKAAGLNRILAMGSPATTPSGAKATMLNEDALLAEGIKSGVTTALDALRLKNETAMTQAQIRLLGAQEKNVGADTILKGATTKLTSAQRVNETLRQAGIRTDNQRKTLEYQIRTLEIPGVMSAKDFYDWLIASPEKNRQYHLQKVYGSSELGTLQKWLMTIGKSQEELDDIPLYDEAWSIK